MRLPLTRPAKGEYIFGHMFGGIGVVISGCNKLYCALASLRLHDGLSAISGWHEYTEESHVVKIIKDAGRVCRALGPALLLLDRLYLTVPMLKALALEPMLTVVTKAKINAKAFLDPKPRKKGRGAPSKKGEKIKVASLFESMAASFTDACVSMYGKTEEVSYYCADLLWGDKLYQKLRFVLVWLDGTKTILATTDLTLAPVDIIELYCHRFKIECAFRELKQVVAGFGYRFWSKHMQKLNRFKSNEYHQDLLKNITCKSERNCIMKTVRAIENFALIGCISLGLLQMLSLVFAGSFVSKTIRYMRTPSKAVPSEATVADYLRKTIYQLLHFFPNLAITVIIKSRQSMPDGSEDKKLA